MVHLWHDIIPGIKVPTKIHVVVEVPMGSKCKYELGKTVGVIRVDRVLATAVRFPQNYGFVPQTLAEDDDPLDALVLSQIAFEPGTYVRARPIGVIHMIDENKVDDKLICVPYGDPKYEGYNDFKSLPKNVLAEIEEFFKIYKRLEGKKVKVKKTGGKLKAHNILKRSIQRYADHFLGGKPVKPKAKKAMAGKAATGKPKKRTAKKRKRKS